MSSSRIAAFVFTVCAAAVVAFQIALAAGMPWGAYAMGGVHPGQFPPAMRIGAIVQALLIAGMAVVVLARSGLLRVWASASRRLIWVVVAFSAVSLVLNLITPSAGERAIWAPIAFLLFASSLVVAAAGTSSTR